jgi:DNA repair exonuclease SbcCD ATPase subunit
VGDDGKPVDEAECPTCQQTITRKFIAGKVAEHQQLEKQVEAGKASLACKQRELGDIAGAEAKIKANDAKLAEKLETVKQITAAGERITFIETAIKDLETALADAKAKEASPVDTSALDALTSEIGEWEARLSPAVRYESTLAEIERNTKQRDDAQAKVSELETLCSYWGDKGVKAKLIKEHIGGFQDSVNSVLSKWGYEARLSIEPYCFEVMTPRTAPNFLSIKRLSGFESLAFAVALQCAIAVATKIKMVIVDEVDTMIGAQRNRLFGCIKAMLDSGQLEQAILLLAE